MTCNVWLNCWETFYWVWEEHAKLSLEKLEGPSSLERNCSHSVKEREYDTIWLALLLDIEFTNSFLIADYTVLKGDVAKTKFLKLWDLLRYSESTWCRVPTCQKSISYCYMGMRYWPFHAPVTPYKSLYKNTCQKSISYCYMGMKDWLFHAPVTPYKSL